MMAEVRQMKRLFIGVIGILFVSVLLAGCHAPAPATGKITNVKFSLLPGESWPVTLIVITGADGEKHYAGLFGHIGGFVVGDTVRAGFRGRSVAIFKEAERIETNNGSYKFVVKEIHFMEMAWYKVLSRAKENDRS